jgi:hypothetical protein
MVKKTKTLEYLEEERGKIVRVKSKFGGDSMKFRGKVGKTSPDNTKINIGGTWFSVRGLRVNTSYDKNVGGYGVIYSGSPINSEEAKKNWKSSTGNLSK